jgi:hypothetical protein
LLILWSRHSEGETFGSSSPPPAIPPSDCGIAVASPSSGPAIRATIASIITSGFSQSTGPRPGAHPSTAHSRVAASFSFLRLLLSLLLRPQVLALLPTDLAAALTASKKRRPVTAGSPFRGPAPTSDKPTPTRSPSGSRVTCSPSPVRPELRPPFLSAQRDATHESCNFLFARTTETSPELRHATSFHRPASFLNKERRGRGSPKKALFDLRYTGSVAAEYRPSASFLFLSVLLA